MKITYDGVILPMDPADMLEDVETRLARGADSAERQSLEAERDTYRREVDAELLERWENLHAAYWRHRRGLREHEEALRTLAPDYCRAIHRARARYDREHAALENGYTAADFLLHGESPNGTNPHDEQEVAQ